MASLRRKGKEVGSGGLLLCILVSYLLALLIGSIQCNSYDDGIHAPQAGDGTSGGGGFVKREGRHLYDSDGNPFYIVGTNIYYLLEHASESEPWLKRSIVDDSFDAARKLNLNTVRTWAFYDEKFQTQPGVYDEKFFDALDFVIAKAREYDLKLVLSLTNYWDAYGGMETYVKWANNRTATNDMSGLSVTDFYTSQACRDMYKSNFLALKDRYNKYTNLTYANDDTILAWELANEPRHPGDYEGQVLQEWIREMSRFVKEQAPKQLVTSGSEGFFGPSTLQYMYMNGNGTFDHNQYLPQMCTGVDFLSNHDDTTAIDLPSFHLYPDHHAEELCGRGAPASDCALQWTQAQTKTRLELSGSVLQKPLFIGEFGKMKHPTMPGTLDAQVVYRNRLYAQVYKMIQQSAVGDFDEESTTMNSLHQHDNTTSTSGVGGSTFWMLASKDYKDYDNFTVYAYTNGPSLPPPWVPEYKAVSRQSDFRNFAKEQECVAKVLEAHANLIDHRWFVAGHDADEWDDTISKIDRGSIHIRSSEEDADTAGTAYTFTFDPTLPERWTLDASTVELITNHASNMNQLANLNKHEWYG